MGLDLSSIPVRLDAEWVKLLRTDADVWDQAMSSPPFGRLPPPDSLPEGYRAQTATERFVDRTFHFPDRSQDQARYLLDPDRFRSVRTWKEQERSLPNRVVYGDEEFAEHAPGWRCSRAAFLVEAADLIDALDLPAARRAFSVEEMAELGVYEFRVGEPADRAFTRILSGLHGLSDHYRRVAARGLDLILQCG